MRDSGIHEHRLGILYCSYASMWDVRLEFCFYQIDTYSIPAQTSTIIECDAEDFNVPFAVFQSTVHRSKKKKKILYACRERYSYVVSSPFENARRIL